MKPNREPDFTVGSSDYFIDEMLMYNRALGLLLPIRIHNGKLIRQGQPTLSEGSGRHMATGIDGWVYFHTDLVDKAFINFLVDNILLKNEDK